MFRLRLMKMIITMILIICPSFSYAKVRCTEPDISLLVPFFTTREAAKSWVPDVISFDKNSVDWYGARLNEAGSETEFYFFVDGKKMRGSYSAARNRLKFQLGSKAGFKLPGPVFYRSCRVSSSSGSDNAPASTAQRAFKSVSSCARRFIQSYLRSAGLYNSSIDGKWGNGTSRALRSAKTIKRFRNMPEHKILETLEKEAPC